MRAVLRSLLDSFVLLSVIADADNMNYDSICALLKAEMEHRNALALVDQTNVVIPAAKMTTKTLSSDIKYG